METKTAELSAEQVLRAGGLLPPGSTGDRVDSVDAVRFAHPGLSGRVVVRLVPANLRGGVDTEMGLAGFVPAGSVDGVAAQRRRAPGFPAWALVNDPKNARYALDVMKDFNLAKKRIASKPGHARDAYVEIAKKLGNAAPHFLPSYWEEAGRAFIAAGSIAMATTAFEKAREAERMHGLAVDEDARAEAFVEFAVAGALSVKSMMAWPADLRKSKGPEVAFERLFDLAVRRTRGGRAPWASLSKDLRDAAKAAGKDGVVEEARFIRAVIGTSAIKRTPVAFWKEAKKATALLAKEPEIALQLAKLFPEETSSAELWIGLLFEWGVVGHLAEHGIAGGVAAWMTAVFGKWDTAAVAIEKLAVALTPRLLAEGEAITVFDEDSWRIESLDAMETLLAAGVQLRTDGTGGSFALSAWARVDSERRDPVHVAAHETLGQILHGSVRSCMDEEDFQNVAVGKTAFAESRRTFLVEQAAELDGKGLIDFATALGEIESNVPESLRAEFPAEAAPLLAADVVGALVVTLRGGIVDELGWEAYEVAWEELGGDKNENLEIHSQAPWVILNDERRAVVVGPGGVELKVDLTLPKGGSRRGFRYAGGQLLFAWRDRSDWSTVFGCWSGDRKTTLTLDWSGYGDDVDAALAGGLPVFDKRALRPGDTVVGSGTVFADAEGAWGHDDGALHAIDVQTGKVGDVDSPAALAERDGLRPQWGRSRYRPQPVVGSLLGEEGQESWVTFDVDDNTPGGREAWRARHAPHRLVLREGDYVSFDAQGRAYENDSPLYGRVAWPGDAEPRFLSNSGWRSQSLINVNGVVVSPVSDDSEIWRAGQVGDLPIGLWHHFRPRDLAASAALRTISEDDANRLLALVPAEEPEDDEVALTALAAQVVEVLPIAHPRLAKGVAAVVRHAASLRKRLATWRGEDGEEEKVEGITDGELRAAMSGLTSPWGDDDESVIRTIGRASAFLDGEDVSVPGSDLPWRHWLRTPFGLRFGWMSPATPDDALAGYVAVLTALAESRFGQGRPAALFRITAPRSSGWVKWVDSYGDKEVSDEPWTGVVDGRRTIFFADSDDEEEKRITVWALIGPDEAGMIAPPQGSVADERYDLGFDGAALVAGLDARPELPVGDEVYAAIRAVSGLSRVEAAGVWGVLRGFDGWRGEPFGKEGREKLGLKAAEAKVAREALRHTDVERRVEAYHHAIVGWDGDLATLATRVGEGWAAVFGRRAEIDEAVLAKARQDFPHGDGPDALAKLVGIANDGDLQKDAAWGFSSDGSLDKQGEGFDGDTLLTATALVAWLAQTVPGDDVLRGFLPALADAVAARLRGPALLLNVACGSGKAWTTWFKRFDGTPFTLQKSDNADYKPPETKARGGIYASLDDGTVQALVRPSELQPDTRDEVARLVKLEGNYGEPQEWAALLLWEGELAALARDGAAGWGQDPRRTASDAVAAVRAAHDLDEAAATLYLQLLTLPNPTKANIALWNGWKPAVYTGAIAALVDKKLVFEAKRARAGREHFLPGGWKEHRQGPLPLEVWKLPLYGGENPPLGGYLPLAPWGTLFARAWARVVAGDGPRYERI